MFLNYLMKYYQTEERIVIWAHCYSTNTNMTLTNELKRKTNIFIDRFLKKRWKDHIQIFTRIDS